MFLCCFGSREAELAIAEDDKRPYQSRGAEVVHESSHRSTALHSDQLGQPIPIVSPFAAQQLQETSCDANDVHSSRMIAAAVACSSMHAGVSPSVSGALGPSIQPKNSGTLQHLNQQLVSKMKRVINHHSSPLMSLAWKENDSSSSSLQKTGGDGVGDGSASLLQRTRLAADKSNLGGNPAPSAPQAFNLQATMNSLLLLSNTSGTSTSADRQLQGVPTRLRSSFKPLSRGLDRVNESHLEGLEGPTPPSSTHRLSPSQAESLAKGTVVVEQAPVSRDAPVSFEEIKPLRSAIQPKLAPYQKEKSGIRRASLRSHSDPNYDAFRSQIYSLRSAIEVIKTPYAGLGAAHGAASSATNEGHPSLGSPPQRASVLLRKLGKPTTYDRLSQENLQSLIRLQNEQNDFSLGRVNAWNEEC